MIVLGSLVDFGESKELIFYIDENGEYTNTKDELERFAMCLNSPWTQAHDTYSIAYNCKDPYTVKDDSEPDWKCEYKVLGYEYIKSIIYGYGHTPQESLQNCITLFNRLQCDFNKDNESF